MGKLTSETQKIQTAELAELNQAMEQFHEWFAREKSKGLVDIKFFVGNTSSNEATVEKAIFEFNQANKMIEAGITEPHLDGFNA